MVRQPRGDTLAWQTVLGHRPREQRAALAVRFASAGVSAVAVKAALDDGGDALYAAAVSGAAGWAEPFGGPLAVALLAAEVSAQAAQLNSRASAVRALAVGDLLADVSAVTVAARLGVSRQKVYDIGRGTRIQDHLTRVPRRQPGTT